MKLKYLLTILSIFIASFNLNASQSMRRCMLLPISDSVDGVIGFKVFEEIEYYLRESTWCYYRSNSEILDILAGFRRNLHEHLKSEEVLKLLAEKTRAGSLIRIELESDLQGMNVKLDVIGENGRDIYFRKAERLSSDSISLISQTVRNWLNEYEGVIPYDARVVGVLGDQFTADMGREYGVVENRTARIVRPIQKKKHPLLQEVVEWETELIADATFFHIVDMQSQGRVMAYNSQKRLQLNDWIVLTTDEGSEEIEFAPTRREEKAYSFGRVGSLGILLDLGSGSLSQLEGNSNTRKIDGYKVGMSLNGEIWITRNFFTGLDFSRSFGTFSQEEGNFDISRYSVNSGRLKAKLGYKYLPLGFFYGPQVDFYVGYGRYSYGFETSRTDKIADARFGGLMLGTKGTIPFAQRMKAYLQLDFLLKPSFNEKFTLNGRNDSASNFNIGLGIAYDHTPTMSFVAGYDHENSKATFVNPDRDLKYKNSGLKVGTIFSF
jgi:hypothetical protein